jgi:hypothetical protein
MDRQDRAIPESPVAKKLAMKAYRKACRSIANMDYYSHSKYIKACAENETSVARFFADYFDDNADLDYIHVYDCAKEFLEICPNDQKKWRVRLMLENMKPLMEANLTETSKNILSLIMDHYDSLFEIV